MRCTSRPMARGVGLAGCEACGAHWQAAHARRWRPLAVIFLAVFLLLAASGSSKPYYLAPAFPPSHAAATKTAMLPTQNHTGCGMAKRFINPEISIMPPMR